MTGGRIKKFFDFAKIRIISIAVDALFSRQSMVREPTSTADLN